MTIKRIDAYQIKCDGCGEFFRENSDCDPAFCRTPDDIWVWADECGEWGRDGEEYERPGRLPEWWPQRPADLSKELHRVAPVLRSVAGGVAVSWPRTKSRRKVRLEAADSFLFGPEAEANGVTQAGAECES